MLAASKHQVLPSQQALAQICHRWALSSIFKSQGVQFSDLDQQPKSIVEAVPP